VDIDPLEHPAQDSPGSFSFLMQELKRSSTDKLIALRNTSRWVRKYERFRIDEGTPKRRHFRERGVYLITGGLGSIGLLLASHFAKTVHARLVLTSRHGLPAREDWDDYIDRTPQEDPVRGQLLALKGVESAGGEILTVVADAEDEAQMQSAIDLTYRRFGELHGVLHAAGITSGRSLYRPFTDFGEAEVEEQFGPKVYGTYLLDKLLRTAAVDFCILFSSNAAILGGLGYLAYAAANSFMDSFAAARAQQQIEWLSVNWDPWPLETKKHASYRTATDVFAMTEAESVEAFDRLSTKTPAGQLIVATGEFEKRLNRWTTASATSTPLNKYPRPHLETAYLAPRSEVEQQLAVIWQELLGIEEVGINDNFFDLGGHSLLAVRMMGRIRDEMGAEVSIAKLFESPTISQVSTLITPTRGSSEGSLKEETLRILAELS
jgi:NAD(P)-dependent dehydrogenase (short-subunit alcohol dehydrogenase family)/acyl carrier protein